MPNHPLFYPVTDYTDGASVRDRIQMVLALADPTLLSALLVNCIPALTVPERIASISSEVSPPIGSDRAADGVLHFESIQCVLTEFPSPSDSPSSRHWGQDPKDLARLTQHESELHTLGQYLPLAPAISLLAKSGFHPQQIETILRLPPEAWYKSWWQTILPTDELGAPFLRCLRTRHHPNGTLTLQYRDFFELEKPPCFSSMPQRVLLTIRSDGSGFGDTLRQINYQRRALGLEQAILICQTMTDLEAQAFIHQGVSIYPAAELLLPIQADCQCCGRGECPMNGQCQSPVALCYGFLPKTEYV